jgi:hypothetical protein
MTDLLCAVLRGEPVAWPAGAVDDAGAFFEAARDHGVHLLVARRLCETGALVDWPEAVRARFTRALRDETVLEQVMREELRGVIAALSAGGVETLLFKGAALAFTHYPTPVLRPRLDADLLVSPRQLGPAATILERLGYIRAAAVTGSLVSYQVPYVRRDRLGVEHTLDVHWKPANPQVFAETLAVDELAGRAVPVPALGEAARAVGPVDGLALACIHRVAHHRDDARLIWLYDIHLLAGGLTPGDAEAFLVLAGEKRIRAVAARGCALAAGRFGTPFPVARFVARLEGGPDPNEPSAQYLRAGIRKVDVLVSDLKALDRWSDRLRLLREHVFPPPAYMQQAYGVSNRAWLPWLYARRFVGGARGWFRRTAARQRDR